MIMTNVNDLNIKFNNKFEKKILSDDSVKIIFFNKKRKISYIPSWFDQKIISYKGMIILIKVKSADFFWTSNFDF